MDSRIPFSSFSLYLQDAFIQKFNFKQFAAFEETCEFARALLERNRKLTFPVDSANIIITNDNIYMNDAFQSVIPSEMCEKMKFLSAGIFLCEKYPSERICDFLLKQGDIHTLKWPFPKTAHPHIVDFFKKANIRSLKLSTLELLDYIDEFPIDTSNIGQVEVDCCMPLSLHAIFSIKARRSLNLSSVWVSSAKLMEYIEEMKKNTEMADLTIDIFIRDTEDFRTFESFLEEKCIFVDDTRWNLYRENEEQPCMEIEMNRVTRFMKFRRL